MNHAVVALAALLAALLTLFSGFGLGTLLLPVFALFFPLDVAVAATAVVHLANNLFKAALLGRHARGAIVLRFGLPAAAAAILGAMLLARLSAGTPLATWSLAGRPHHVTPLGLVLGGLIAVFALLELLPAFARLQFAARWLPWGGVLSGFCGGLSGHQGALRAAFLAKTGLDRDAFLGTSILCAVLVDVARLAVYGATFVGSHFGAVRAAGGGALVGTAIAAAFLGSWVGTRLVRKVTMHLLQKVIGAGMVLLAAAIAAGLV